MVILSHEPGWFTVGGAVISAIGALHWAKRLTRLGPNRADEPLPPVAYSEAELSKMGMPTGGPLQLVKPLHFHELEQRARDNWYAFIGVWLTVAGAIVAAVPFLWSLVWPTPT